MSILSVFNRRSTEANPQPASHINWDLNVRASHLAESFQPAAATLRIVLHDVPGGGRVLDCGVASEGGLGAGLALAQVCTAGLADISLIQGEIAGHSWPHVLVATDHAVPACLLSQYAGWQIGVEKFFAMGSGPMRALSAREEVFKKLDYREKSDKAVGVLEGRKLPTAAVLHFIAEKTGVAPQNTRRCFVAPDRQPRGKFSSWGSCRRRNAPTNLFRSWDSDVNRIRSAVGSAPLSPVAHDDSLRPASVGRTTPFCTADG